MKRTVFKFILPLSGAVILSVALVFLYKELGNYHLGEIIQKLIEFPKGRLLAAVLVTALSYFAVTFYDLLAFRYIKQKLAYSRIFFTSLVSYIFGNNIGMSVLSSGTVRFRFYSAAGISSLDIVKIITFTATTFWIGIISLAGIVFVIEPVTIPAILHIPFVSLRPFGALLLCIVALYITLTVFYKKTFYFKEWEIEIPDWKIGLGQIAVSFIDWSIAGLVLYFLLPDTIHLSYIAFIPVFLLAQISGLISHVPGGVGVFETVIMLMLSGQGGTSDIFSSLILYRFVYYLCPFAVGLVLFITAEISVTLGAVKKAASFALKWAPLIFPGVLAILIFISGAVILLSTALPNIGERMTWLNYIFPVHVMEVSHFFTALSGAGLLFLSSRIQKRLYSAYYMTIILLVSGIIFLMLSGLNYEEVTALVIALALFYPCRKFFYRRASLFDQSFSPAWGAAIATVITITIWFGLFAYKHIPYSHGLWSSFGLLNDTSRFMRGFAGVFLFFSILSLILFLRPARVRPSLPSGQDIEIVKSIIDRSGSPDGNLALLGDKYIFFNMEKTAFIMYGIQGKSWIVLGDPIGCKDDIPEIIWDFREESYKEDANLVFFEVASEYLPVYIETGMNILKIGEAAHIDLLNFNIQGSDNRGLRHSLNKTAKENYVFEIIPAENVQDLIAELKTVSDNWLGEKNTKEKQFSIGFFDEAYLKNFPMAIVKKENRIVAFANMMYTSDKGELTIDLMRHHSSAPGGIMDFLFLNIMLWGKENGFKDFNLGSVPLSGLVNKPLAPLWNRIGAVIFGYSEKFYNFQGLRSYKNKFHPDWQSRYLVYSKPLALPRSLIDIAILVSGGLKGVVSK